jgi:Pyridine nucleotide-disulphide oxidoreductase
VERVAFHNEENGFCVLRTKARGHRDLVTVVGHSATISAGEWITATGEWVNDRTLVIAIGSISNDFGTPGVKDHAICLDTPEQMQRFNRRLVNACLRAHTQAEPVRPGQLHVATIGAGARGDRAELAKVMRRLHDWGLGRIVAWTMSFDRHG